MTGWAGVPAARFCRLLPGVWAIWQLSAPSHESSRAYRAYLDPFQDAEGWAVSGQLSGAVGGGGRSSLHCFVRLTAAETGTLPPSPGLPVGGQACGEPRPCPSEPLSCCGPPAPTSSHKGSVWANPHVDPRTARPLSPRKDPAAAQLGACLSGRDEPSLHTHRDPAHASAPHGLADSPQKPRLKPLL